jgi:multidrug efflux pump subunit AcrA (membrane-fusion protein)
MKLSRYAKPVLTLAGFVVLGWGWYAFEHRSRPEEKETGGNALVIVTKSTNACFSDVVRGTGFIVPRREAVVGVDQEGSRVTEVLVREGDTVTETQELVRLTPPGQPAARASAITLRAPAPGLVTEVKILAGQAGPMFRIAINNELELDAEVPSVHLLKLNPGAAARISRDNAPDLAGRVRLVSPQIDRATQLGHVRISFANNPALKLGTFARVNIDAKRSCGVAVPRTAIDHLTVQVVKGNRVETRKVRTGLVSDTATEILEGLDAGETVVADAAASSLHDGDLIRTMSIKVMSTDELDRARVR